MNLNVPVNNKNYFNIRNSFHKLAIALLAIYYAQKTFIWSWLSLIKYHPTLKESPVQ